jgi:hypothetical protein
MPVAIVKSKEIMIQCTYKQYIQNMVASFVNTEWKYKYVELSFYIEGSVNITIYIYIFPFCCATLALYASLMVTLCCKDWINWFQESKIRAFVNYHWHSLGPHIICSPGAYKVT